MLNICGKDINVICYMNIWMRFNVKIFYSYIYRYWFKKNYLNVYRLKLYFNNLNLRKWL